MNALIVCHAGAGLGLGHLTRSIVVARALYLELGMNVNLLIQGDSIQRTDLAEFHHKFLGPDENLITRIEEHARHVNAQIIVLDLYPRRIPENIDKLLQKLRRVGFKLIAVDALLGHRENLDMVFIPSFRFLPPAGLTGTAPILFGWDCFLLNVESLVIEWKPGRQVLVLAGGSDATGLGKTFPALLNAALPVDTELHWVTGPYAQQPVWPNTLRISMLNHQSPSGLDNMMVRANYAVTVYGVSLFELLYFGVPTVVFSPYGHRDDADLAAIAAEGVGIVAKDEEDAVTRLKELMADDTLAAALSLRARQRLSSTGGHKFAQAVAELMTYS